MSIIEELIDALEECADIISSEWGEETAHYQYDLVTRARELLLDE